MVYKRVSNWNSKRYERVFNLELTTALLTEELKEWFEASSDVDKLDALCDITYVALGAIWKSDVEFETLGAATDNAYRVVNEMLDINELNPAYLISTHLAVLQYDHEYPVVDSMAMIIVAATAQMMGMGLTLEQTFEALNIVCDSNDTKVIEQLKPGEKGFRDTKGLVYVAPEPRLQALLDRRMH
jgi:hypothetical protein